MDEYDGHWEECDLALGVQPLILRLPDNTTMTRAQFGTLRTSLLTQQNVVQGRRTAEQVAQSVIESQKTALMAKFTLFTGILDAYFQGTYYIRSRPLAPTFTAGQILFTDPMIAAMELWEDINEGTAPAGVALPLVLPDGTVHGSFASAVSSLQFAYADAKKKGNRVTISRDKRTGYEERAHTAMKLYRDAVPPKLMNFPELISSLPRLTPLPGHTPEAVNASAVFEAPDKSRTIYDESAEPALHSYQLRGSAGEDYDHENSVVLATNAPGAAREFVTTFGLNQPGAKIALKVYVILTTGNEAGSATMSLQRPLAQVA